MGKIVYLFAVFVQVSEWFYIKMTLEIQRHMFKNNNLKQI